MVVLLGAGCASTQPPVVVNDGNQNKQPVEQKPDNQQPDTTNPQQTGSVKIYLIALNDAGKSGKAIGCDDSVVGINVTIANPQTPLTEAIKELLKEKGQYYGQTGLYNSLYQSDLTLQSAAITNGKATIHLTGQYSLGGVCDNPRFEAQLEETALQFPNVQSVEVFVNGIKLEDILSGK